MARVDFGEGRVAVLDEDLKWSSNSDALELILNTRYTPDRLNAVDPNPVATLAQLAAENLGGRAIDLPPTEYKKGVVY